MGLFRRTPKLTVTPFRTGVLNTRLSQATVTIAVDEMDTALHGAGVAVADVSRDQDEVCVMFRDFADVNRFLELVFGDDVGTPGSMQDRASEGCITEAAGEDYKGVTLITCGTFPWNWDVHPSWIDGELSWHVSVTIPLEDALSAIATLNSKGHGDSL